MTKQRCRIAPAFLPARAHRLMWLAVGQPRTLPCNPGKGSGRIGIPAGVRAGQDLPQSTTPGKRPVS
jgi:hypothetical protein